MVTKTGKAEIITNAKVLKIEGDKFVSSISYQDQLNNKENALALLAARLLEKKQEEDSSAQGGARREQIGWAKRAEKIRTYNYPQNRITDHRIDKSWHNLEAIVNGDLEPIIKAFKTKK